MCGTCFRSTKEASFSSRVERSTKEARLSALQESNHRRPLPRSIKGTEHNIPSLKYKESTRMETLSLLLRHDSSPPLPGFRSERGRSSLVSTERCAGVRGVIHRYPLST